MPLVEKTSSEEELQAQIERLQLLIKRNPAVSRDQSVRLQAAKDELNRLLLQRPGYRVVSEAEIQSRIDAAVAAALAERTHAS